MDQPQLIIFSGLPGSGKSTLAETVAKALDMPLFSVDPIESAILSAGITKSFETGVAAYLVASNLAKEHIMLGKSVIIDAVNAEEEARDVWRELAKKLDTKLKIIEVYVSDAEEHRKRIQARVRNLHGIPEVTWERVESRRKEYGEWKESTLRLDSMSSTDANSTSVISYIRGN